MGLKVAFVTKDEETGDSLWAVQEERTGEYLFGPAPWLDCVVWRRDNFKDHVSDRLSSFSRDLRFKEMAP